MKSGYEGEWKKSVEIKRHLHNIFRLLEMRYLPAAGDKCVSNAIACVISIYACWNILHLHILYYDITI